jgi:ubiquitin fusion degradation protein 1
MSACATTPARAKQEAKLAAEQAAAEKQQKAAAAAEAAKAAEVELKRVLAHKQALLPPEPDMDQSAVVIAVSMPNGTRITRRFYRDASLQSLFDWVDVEGAPRGVVQLGGYALVTRMPRRVFRAPGGCSSSQGRATLLEAGISSDTTVLVEQGLPISWSVETLP